MRKSWWKIVCVILLAYSLIGGLLLPVPRKFILNETIRNLYYHVPMWFTMISLFGVAVYHSIMYLAKGDLRSDIFASEYTMVGIFFSVLGLVTGMEWAKFTWGEPWSNDPKQLGTAICMLIYFAYLILRGGMKDEEKRAKISAVYNIFAFAMMIPLLFILPRLTDSLHPGNGGNPGFNSYDLDSAMRRVFYPAVIGWVMLGVWITTLRARVKLLIFKKENAFLMDFDKKLNNA